MSTRRQVPKGLIMERCEYKGRMLQFQTFSWRLQTTKTHTLSSNKWRRICKRASYEDWRLGGMYSWVTVNQNSCARKLGDVHIVHVGIPRFFYGISARFQANHMTSLEYGAGMKWSKITSQYSALEGLKVAPSMQWELWKTKRQLKWLHLLK